MPNSLKNNYSVLIFILLLCAGFKSPAQQWQTVKGGMNYPIVDINYDSLTNSLFLGGGFQYADTVTGCAGIANWDGSAFTKLTPPVNNCNISCGPATSIVRYHNRLFMCGYYGPYNGKTEQLFEYVNDNWIVSCALGKSGGISYLKVINDKLFAFGLYDSLCGQNIQSVAVFNGTDWEAFNPPSPIFFDPHVSSPSYWINTGEYYKGEYYFGGNFNDANGFNEILRWTGTQWLPLQTGIHGGFASVQAMKVYKGVLYVGGYFFNSDGNIGNCIMGWDGNNWFDPFPQVFYIAAVNDLEIINDQLYISGNYVIPGDNDSAMYVMARYDGCNFKAFGGKCKYPQWEAAPRSIAGLKGQLYAAVDYSFFIQPTNWFVTIPESTPNLRTIPINSCPEMTSEFPFSIYPNPYSDNITIQLPSDYSLTETKFIITNALGQNLFTVYPESYQQFLDLSSLSSGMYFITVQDKSNKKTVKVIKQ